MPVAHVQGYFYWWVIVSMVWGLIAACIAIVLPVWEVGLLNPLPEKICKLLSGCVFGMVPWASGLCPCIIPGLSACAPVRIACLARLMRSFSGCVRAGKGNHLAHHCAPGDMSGRYTSGRVPQKGRFPPLTAITT